MQLILRFVRDESGTTAMEYGLIAGIVSLAVIAGATATGTTVNSIFMVIGTQLANSAAAITG